MSDPIADMVFRKITIKPHTKSYQHREILCVYVTFEGKRANVQAITEHGEIIKRLDQKLLTHPRPYVVVTNASTWLAEYLVNKFGRLEGFQLKVTETRGEGQTEIIAKLSRFGISNKEASGKRKVGLHTVWSVSDFPTSLFPQGKCDPYTLLSTAVDIRNYCKESGIPLPSKPKGIAGDFLKDARFWPDGRGRVPTFINDNLRGFLPGNHMELRGKTRMVQNVWSIDMRNAYHRVAQYLRVPDHTHIYARGFTRTWKTAPIWFASNSVEYAREIARPGFVIVEATSRPTRNSEWRPKAINYSGKKRIGLWTNEIEFVESMGVDIHGIIASWTSHTPDMGLSRYAQFAESEANRVSPDRKKWLKPTLHSLYGMLAANKRRFRIGHLRGNSKRQRFFIGWNKSIDLCTFSTGAISHPVTNVAMLGILQAEIRCEMFRLANWLESNGHPVSHIHADGLHVATDDLPLLSSEWKVSQMVDLVYIDDVSWIWSDGETLPGRPEIERQREVRRYKDMLAAGVYGYRRKYAA
jgi:hypothetical protein